MKYSKYTKDRGLAKVTNSLAQMMVWVDEHVQELTFLEGHRPDERQNEYFAKGKSKVKAGSPAAKHNTFPSQAVDIAPWPIRWGIWPKPDPNGKVSLKDAKRTAKELARYYYVAGAMKAKATMDGVDLRWGGDWRGTGDFEDNVFDDLVHFEIREEE